MPRLQFLAVMVLSGATALGCRSALERHTRLIGPETYAIDCGEETAECYEFALQLCPYGYTTEREDSEFKGASVAFGALSIKRQKSIVAQCKAPTFCELETCPYGTRCVQSQSFPGRQVCAVAP